MARLLSKKHTEGRASQWPWNRTNIFLPWAQSPKARPYLTHQEWMCWGRLTPVPQKCRSWFCEGGQWATEWEWKKNLKHTVGWALGELMDGWPPETGTRRKYCALYVWGPQILILIKFSSLKKYWTWESGVLTSNPELFLTRVHSYTNYFIFLALFPLQKWDCQYQLSILSETIVMSDAPDEHKRSQF